MCWVPHRPEHELDVELHRWQKDLSVTHLYLECSPHLHVNVGV